MGETLGRSVPVAQGRGALRRFSAISDLCRLAPSSGAQVDLHGSALSILPVEAPGQRASLSPAGIDFEIGDVVVVAPGRDPTFAHSVAGVRH